MSDDVRSVYRELTETEKAQIDEVKGLGQEFITLCKRIGVSRELSIAVTNAEQAVMWAVKHITR